MQLKRLAAWALHLVMVLGLCAPAAFAAGDTAPGYVLRGGMNGSTYDLQIYITGLEAFSGRIGLTFDTEKLSLIGSGLAAFRMESGATAVSEQVPETQLVSAADGYACMAWHVGSLDATQSEKHLATLQFMPVSGAGEIDQSTFGLRCITSGDMGEWSSAAHLRGRGELSATTNSYLVDGVSPCAVTFAYDGVQREPVNGKNVIFTCKTKLEGKPISGEMILGGRTYQTDANGQIRLKLGDGAYLWQVEAAGYGRQRGRIEVFDDAEQQVLFLDDAELVREAAKNLRIRFQTGDSETRVTGAVGLTARTEEDVAVTWQSNEPNVITGDGLVFLPASEQVTVQLTATLAKGSAREQKTFTVVVLSKKQLQAEAESGGNTRPNTPATRPQFNDLTGYEWAQPAIEKLAQAGIIKGTSETTFGPGQNIKRGDYIALLMRMIDPVGTPTGAFADVPRDSYYYEEIAQARVLGIINGTGDNRFEPEKPISRQDMMTMTARAIERTSYLKPSQKIGDLKQFADAAQIAEYARQSVAEVVGRGLITGDTQRRILPLDNATRAETAVLIERMYSAH